MLYHSASLCTSSTQSGWGLKPRRHLESERKRPGPPPPSVKAREGGIRSRPFPQSFPPAPANLSTAGPWLLPASSPWKAPRVPRSPSASPLSRRHLSPLPRLETGCDPAEGRKHHPCMARDSCAWVPNTLAPRSPATDRRSSRHTIESTPSPPRQTFIQMKRRRGNGRFVGLHHGANLRAPPSGPRCRGRPQLATAPDTYSHPPPPSPPLPPPVSIPILRAARSTRTSAALPGPRVDQPGRSSQTHCTFLIHSRHADQTRGTPSLLVGGGYPLGGGLADNLFLLWIDALGPKFFHWGSEKLPELSPKAQIFFLVTPRKGKENQRVGLTRLRGLRGQFVVSEKAKQCEYESVTGSVAYFPPTLPVNRFSVGIKNSSRP